jgi:hypothetical protein
MLSRLSRALLLAVALLSLGAASALADTITLSFGTADPTEEVPVPVTATWSSGDPSASVFVTVKPAGSLGCAQNYSVDDPNSDDLMWDRGGALTGTTTENLTESAPGTWTLCGYLQHASDSATPLAVTGPVALSVRSARASVAISAPPRVDPGQTFSISLPVTAELSRALFVTVKPAGGRGCEASYSLDDPNSDDVIWDRGVQGSVTTTQNLTASQTAGTYLLCAYVQESSSDPSPEATSSATFLVGPDPCTTAKTALTKANQAVKTAEAAVSRYRKAYTRDRSRARHAHGAKRRSLLKLYKRDRSRYTSAVRQRAKKRAALSAAQSAKLHACGS